MIPLRVESSLTMRNVSLFTLLCLPFFVSCASDSVAPKERIVSEVSRSSEATPTQKVRVEPGDSHAEMEDEARRRATAMGSSLKAELMAAMGKGGPKLAVEACRVSAPNISDKASTGEWRVGRTALQIRNPKNAPDDWEQRMLTVFQARIRKGEPVMNLDASEIVEADGVRTFRYIKAIVTAPPCLVCHGPAIEPDLADEIARRYPNDKATGFVAGELRGAFTVSKTGVQGPAPGLPGSS